MRFFGCWLTYKALVTITVGRPEVHWIDSEQLDKHINTLFLLTYATDTGSLGLGGKKSGGGGGGEGGSTSWQNREFLLTTRGGFWTRFTQESCHGKTICKIKRSMDPGFIPLRRIQTPLAHGVRSLLGVSIPDPPAYNCVKDGTWCRPTQAHLAENGKSWKGFAWEFAILLIILMEECLYPGNCDNNSKIWLNSDLLKILMTRQ